jgi:hypothetical protein
LVQVLVAQGEQVVSPQDRRGLMPLLVPLTAATDSPDPTFTCLLRWPEGHRGMELPVVRMQRRGTAVALAARSAEEYVKRALVEDEQLQREGRSDGAVTGAAGTAAAELYRPGGFSASGSPSMNAYLTKQVGMFPDVAEALALAHLSRGDTMSALITGEWYMRRGQFPEWGRPYEFNSWLMKEVGRPEESRDVVSYGR